MIQYLDLIVGSVLSFLLGGGVWKWLKTRNEARLIDQQEKTLGSRTEVELHDISLGSLLKVNKALQEQLDRERADTLRERGEKEALRAELEEVRREVLTLEEDLRTAQAAARELQCRLESLMQKMADPQKTYVRDEHETIIDQTEEPPGPQD